MAALITRSLIGVALLMMFTAFTFMFLVEMGNEYDVSLGNEYDGRFGLDINDQRVLLDNSIGGIVSNSTDLQEAGEVDNTGFDAVQSPGSIDGVNNLINVRAVMTDFATDFNSVGFAFSPIITYTLLVILVIGLFVSAAYIYFKVIP